GIVRLILVIALDGKSVEDARETSITELAKRAVARDAWRQQRKLIGPPAVERQIVDLSAIHETDFGGTRGVDDRRRPDHLHHRLEIPDDEHNAQRGRRPDVDSHLLLFGRHESALRDANDILTDRQDRHIELTRTTGDAAADRARARLGDRHLSVGHYAATRI